MTTALRLHYAPDNASLCVRLALDCLGRAYDPVLVDRSTRDQKSAAYMALNPNGLIPVLETPQGPLFETAAILLWLADQHPGTLMPAPKSPDRGPALTWLFWLANTVHPALRMLFYPDQYTASDPAALRARTRERLIDLFALLDRAAPAFLTAPQVTAQGCYLAPMLRWCVLYGGDSDWFDLDKTPALADFDSPFVWET